MTFSSRRRRSAATSIIAGAASMTFDHHMSRPKVVSTADALAGDWKAVGGDLRRALRHERGDFEAA